MHAIGASCEHSVIFLPVFLEIPKMKKDSVRKVGVVAFTYIALLALVYTLRVTRLKNDTLRMKL